MGRKLSGLLALALLGAAAALPASSPAAPSGLIAPPSACPGQSNPGAPVAEQVAAMRCLTNYARQRRGRSPLRRVAVLDRAARGKAGDILRCDEFDHAACGREFT